MVNVEIPNWLKGLPLAPEFRPTDTEFADPIAYISKIEKEAGSFGICKIIPPLPKPSKKFVLWNLNKSLSKSPELSCDANLSNVCSPSGVNGDDREFCAVFTTRHQELGQSAKRTKGAVPNPQLGVHKQVWQSGEVYTLERFESKSKAFARSILGGIKEVCPLVIEAMFWKAASEKPIYVEYANDVPGSGFGTPEGKFHYIHRRRRKRNFYQRRREISEFRRNDMLTVKDSNACGVGDTSTKDISNACPETSKSYTSSILSSDDNLHSSWRKSLNASNDMEGSAGWKLSNSPWNLQVIARSSGSLTSFMPDDIPGVTSPMIYIGMLFSWFAWHVEDHELHSMNFLHTGSQKTWYAVPGDYAFAFEEVVRAEAYGGNIDYLAALTLLGEKTTLLSPEVVIASGIPCCRLVQNPGEFVVTFPRAYHVGFSHGFNCGEAANFGTPQWLQVAKEAAVRRAAMNYLPMLSHQQLLYLLTMSFVSRVPRSLLPGVRSSRLRDRLKEERELSVKKGFLDDILRENNVLSSILKKEPSCLAVLWSPDLLPCSIIDHQLARPSAEVAMTPRDNVSHNHFESDTSNDNDKNVQNDLADEMSLYLERMNDLYLDSDDLSCDFQVDSGTLACVACGILGFPFMSVVQPSEKASIELLPVDRFLTQEGTVTSGPENTQSSSSLGASLLEDPRHLSDVYPPPKDVPVMSTTNFGTGWNSSSVFLRPRSFCMEHALEIVELLQSKGGANVLVICHSDFQKIKAHAVAIAEEVGSPFQYNDVPLEIASQEDLKLIDLAIDGEHNECGEDWTSQLGINLRYCVKARKNFPSKQVQHALTLDGLFSIRSPRSDSSTINWQSKRSRSKKLTRTLICKPCQGIPTKNGQASLENSDGKILKKEEKLIQYRRRNKRKSGKPQGIGVQVQPSCERPDHSTTDTSEMQLTIKVNKEENEENKFSCAIESTSSLNSASDERIKMHQEQKFKDHHDTFEECDVSEEQLHVPADVDVLTKEIDLVKTTSSNTYDRLDGSFEGQVESAMVENSSTSIEVNMTLNGLQEEIETANGIEDNESVSCPTQVKQLSLALNEESCDDPGEIHATEGFSHVYLDEKMDKEIDSTKNGNEKEPVSTFVKLVNQSTPASVEETFEAKEICAASNLGNDVTSEALKEIQAVEVSREELFCSFVNQVQVNQRDCFPADKRLETLGRSVEEDLANVLTSHAKAHKVMQPKNRTEEELVSSFSRQPDGQSFSLENVERKSESVDDDNGESASRFDAQMSKKPILGEIQTEFSTSEDNCDDTEVCSSKSSEEVSDTENAVPNPISVVVERRKRKREVEQEENKVDYSGFIRSPCEGLRPRGGKDVTTTGSSGTHVKKTVQERLVMKKLPKPSDLQVPSKGKKGIVKGTHKCDLEGCRMSFRTKAELVLHKSNRCPQEGCGKKFSSHKYAMLHQRVHDDERPLKCPWKGCSMSFKWAWARTEHIRVHTGERPYQCKVDGCGLSFRFVSDFSRHRRKTGHYVEQTA